MFKLPTLYAYDSKGKVRVWSVASEGDNVIVSYGLKDGKMAEKITKAKPKNKGKANAATAEQQAVLEAESKWRHQKDREDYHEEVEKSGLQLRPQLARDYLKVGHQVDYVSGVACQPKLDGLRLTAGWRYKEDTDQDIELMTREGLTYQVEHLMDPCTLLLEEINRLCNGKCQALDGEVYLHGLPLQKTVSYAKKYRKGLTETLEFHVFDLCIPDLTFDDRYKILCKAYRNVIRRTARQDLIKLVETDFSILCEEDVLDLHGTYAGEGYEGIMIRSRQGEYSFAQRSPHLFKYKKFYDDEFLITDVWEDKNGNAMFTCKWPANKIVSFEDTVQDVDIHFDCTPKRTHEERKAMLKNRESYIGKWITVKYQALSLDNVPTFPVGLALRDCSSDGKPLI